MSEPPGSASPSRLPGAGTLHRVRFVPEASEGQEVLLTFVDPVPHKAVCLAGAPSFRESMEAAGAGIDILTVPASSGEQPSLSDELVKWVADAGSPGAAPPTVFVVHGTQIVWSHSRAAILAAPDRTTPFLLAVVDFSYYECQLRKLEREIGEGWPQLELDSPLAAAVTTSDPDRFEDVAGRMDQALKRRMRLARIVPHLYQPRPHLPLLANQLVERLRERTYVEDRHEALVSQLEVVERVYELNSQRISDFRAAQQQKTLELVIIVLLAAETILLLIDLLWTLGI